MAQLTYSPTDVVCTFNGIIVQGLADAGITVAYDSAMWNFVEGLDGQLARVRTGKQLGTVTLNLMQTSATNDEFNAMFEADVLSGTGHGMLYIADLSRRRITTCVDASFEKKPDHTLGLDMADVQWVLKGRLNVTMGGTSS